MQLSPHAFTLRQLQYAVAVAETANFRRAAAQCHVSQPSLSAQIAELESALGVRLFERDRKRVMLTAAGREVVARGRRLLVETADLAAAAARFGDPLRGSLRFGVIPTVSPYLLPEVVPALRRRFPKLTMHWVEEKTATLVSLVQAGSLDAALLALEADVGHLERLVVGRDPFVLATPRGHVLSRRAAPVTLGQLRGSPVLLLDDGHCLRDQALAVCSAMEAQELDFRATSLATLAQMVAGGAGITLLPRLAVRAENRRAQLVVRRFAGTSPHRTIGLVWRPRSPLAPALTQVGTAVRELYQAAEPRFEASLGLSAASRRSAIAPPRRHRRTMRS